MALQSINLQEIVLPNTPEMEECEELFFREGLSKELPEDRMTPDNYRWSFSIDNGTVTQDRRMMTSAKRHALELASNTQAVRYDHDDDCLLIPAGHLADLSCYLNMISARKWLRTTFVEGLELELDIQGEAHIDIIGYQLDDFTNLKMVSDFNKRRWKKLEDNSLALSLLTSEDNKSSDRTTFSISLGQPEVTLVGVVITAKSNVKLFGGKWIGNVKSSNIRTVNLCISTTTYKKEEYISRNVSSIKKMLHDYPEMADCFRMIIVDNGRTLDPTDFEDDHVSVFGNVNTGGSGGFARGMIEALKLNTKPTHLLLMDDDVLVITESLRRTFTLLRLLRPEYQRHFLSGAMLYLENKDIQHEDIGFVHTDGFYSPKKSVHSLRTIIDCACNEVDWPDFGYEYAGWWYCCIPFEFITEDNLPVPFSIKIDDVEYSVRNNVKILTLNGICTWHMGFRGKVSAGMEYYQVARNSLIMRAFQTKGKNIRFFELQKKVIRQLLNSFAYDYAELMLDAIEDYLQGPSIIEKPNGMEIVIKKSSSNEPFQPIAQIWQGKVNFEKEFDYKGIDSLRSIVKRKIVTYSFNGQLHFRSLISDRIGFIPNFWEYDHRTFFMANSILAVNPVDNTAFERKRNPERFAEVLNRGKKVFKRYEETHEAVEESYRQAFPNLTSISFWKEYLSIE